MIVKVAPIEDVDLDLDITVTNLESGIIELSQPCFGPTMLDSIILHRSEIPNLISVLESFSNKE